jgi:hypothetical protein
MRASFLDVLCARQSRPSLLYTMPEDSWYVQCVAITQERRRSWSSISCRSAASYVGGYRLVASSRYTSSRNDCAAATEDVWVPSIPIHSQRCCSSCLCTVDVSSVAWEALCEICPRPAIFRNRSLGIGQRRHLANIVLIIG